MKSKRQYFIDDALFSTDKEGIIEYMKEFGLSELTVYKAAPIKDPDYFYCKIHGVGEKNGTCGVKWCDDYKPRNGKSGCCVHVGRLFEAGEEVSFKI